MARRKGRKLLVASLGVAAVAYAGCNRPKHGQELVANLVVPVSIDVEQPLLLEPDGSMPMDPPDSSAPDAHAKTGGTTTTVPSSGLALLPQNESLIANLMAPPSPLTPVDGGKVKQGDVAVGASTSTTPIPDLQRTLVLLRPGMRACYQRGLASDPTLTGTLTLTIAVDTQGLVASASSKPSSTFKDAAVVTCILGRVKNAQFSPPSAASVVDVTVTLTPKP